MRGVVFKTLTKLYGDVASVGERLLDIEPTEVASLLGPSGGGKTHDLSETM
jgi:ABC-type Fe3+/spermidine/putrescine transport system ATPase subunit